ncbi:hypothetical protein ACLOJK_039512 [Asimina triloba]
MVLISAGRHREGAAGFVGFVDRQGGSSGCLIATDGQISPDLKKNAAARLLPADDEEEMPDLETDRRRRLLAAIAWVWVSDVGLLTIWVSVRDLPWTPLGKEMKLPTSSSEGKMLLPPAISHGHDCRICRSEICHGFRWVADHCLDLGLPPELPIDAMAEKDEALPDLGKMHCPDFLPLLGRCGGGRRRPSMVKMDSARRRRAFGRIRSVDLTVAGGGCHGSSGSAPNLSPDDHFSFFHALCRLLLPKVVVSLASYCTATSSSWY